MADAENIKRRASIDVANSKKFAIEKFAKSLLDVADNLQRAADSVPEELRAAEDQQALRSLFDGVVMTDAVLQKTFSEHGARSAARDVGACISTGGADTCTGGAMPCQDHARRGRTRRAWCAADPPFNPLFVWQLCVRRRGAGLMQMSPMGEKFDPNMHEVRGWRGSALRARRVLVLQDRLLGAAPGAWGVANASLPLRRRLSRTAATPAAERANLDGASLALQALFDMPDAEKEPGTISFVSTAGYVLNDRCLRAAQVGITRKP
eukprot:5957403-Prymnesium_polylepis.1